MANLAIKEHSTRGNEVIEILEMVECLLGKEETMEEINIDRIGFNGDEAKLILPDGYEFKTEGKEVYVVKKKQQYPKTYKECCDVLGFKNRNKTEQQFLNSCDLYDFALMTKLSMLKLCRDAYWKIAEDWKPDWTKADERKYCIANTEGNITKWVQKTTNKILAFPTEEMRDAFYVNFRELVESVKELL